MTVPPGVIFRSILKVRKSYSYRYAVCGVDGSGGLGPGRNASIIETRYRGRSASWIFRAVTGSGETCEVRGTFVQPPGFEPETIAEWEAEAAAVVGQPMHEPVAAAVDELPSVATSKSDDPPAVAAAPPERSQRPSAVALREFYAAPRRRGGIFDPVVS